MSTRSIYNAAFIISVIGLGGNAFAEESKLSSADQAFVMKLGQGNLDETKLGQLAQQKASEQPVKDFGSRIEKDHTALAKDLKEWASSHKLELPNTLSPHGQAMEHKLSKLSGKDFDKAFITGMMKGHQQTIAEVQKVAETSQHADLKELAKKTLPVLENHIRVAENVAGKLGLSASAGLNFPEHPTG